MGDFSAFDTRGYRTVDVRSGYGQWIATYEDTVRDEMDLALLERLTTVDWAAAADVADLGCGTGRTGAWLDARGARGIDGVDLTPEMLERAHARGIFRSLAEADVRASGLTAGAYDLVSTSLVDEHLPALEPLYAEAFRLARPGGAYVLVGIHPFFLIASGMPTHFDAADGEAVAIETHLHLLGDHVAAAHAAGWVLAELHEAVIGDEWIAAKPRWAAQRGQPISFAFAWRRPA
ncbi:tRNA methyltransferase [Paraconexibacter sp. AEG42_29]|uniref:tRNA methyltransferase n=1 Tax=Paraconexibacter sp. AEG42_29 TaxID=2997339 RepID=A0AAU7AQH3_9ACTN